MSNTIKISSCQDNLSGIYKLNFPNGKSYIGLSNNIKRRMKEHKESKLNLPISRAISKYGIDEFELLETIPSDDRERLQEREKYWIAFYDTTNRDKGYNLTIGGDGASPGVNNTSAKLNATQIEEIYALLSNHKELFIYQIAEQYGISPEAISDINTGKRYYNNNLTYPLRPPTQFRKGQITNQKGTLSHTSKFTEQDVDEIYDLIKNSLISLQEIANMKQVSYTTISKINRGLTYQRENESYPLRKKRSGLDSATCKLTQEKIASIREDLRLRLDLNFTQIGAQYGVSSTTVGKINRGETYRDDSIEYPIRKRKGY